MYFFDNGNHVCHFRLLQQALKHGLILRKVCAVAKFSESRQLEPYTSSNIYYRPIAENHFEKDINKFLFDSAFGKSIQNERNERCMATNQKMRNKYTLPTDFKENNFTSEFLQLMEKYKRKKSKIR